MPFSQKKNNYGQFLRPGRLKFQAKPNLRSKVEAKPGKWGQARFYGMPKLKETCMPILKNKNKMVRPMYLPAMFSLADANKERLTLQSI